MSLRNISDVENNNIHITPVSSTMEFTTGYRVSSDAEYYKVQVFKSDLLNSKGNFSQLF